MGANYLWLKFVHIFVAIVGLGTSAGLGILLEVFGNDRIHGPFVLRAIERLIWLVVLPGYVLILASGLWMANLAWPFSVRWIQLAVGLWIVGLAMLGWSVADLRRQRFLHANEGSASARSRRVSMASRVSGGAFGLVVLVILYLMVFKP